jgi:hypothetical protein
VLLGAAVGWASWPGSCGGHCLHRHSSLIVALEARRRMARRSSAVVPPHTPSVTPWSSAQARH